MLQQPRLVVAIAIIAVWGLSSAVLGVTGRIDGVPAGTQVGVAVVLLLLLPSARGALRTLRDCVRNLRELKAEVRALSEESASSSRRWEGFLKRGEQRLAEQTRSLKRMEEALGRAERASTSGASEHRQLASDVGKAEGTYASRRLNALLGALPTEARYLEIGLDRGRTFEAVKAFERWGVDPRPRFPVAALPHRVTVIAASSDRFFDLLAPDVSFDLVYLDGLHTYEQTYRDLINALGHTAPLGAILVDDVVPSDEVSAIPDQEVSLAERRRRGLEGRPWHGDVFRILKILDDHHPELSYSTIVGADNDQALIWRGVPDSVSSAVSNETLRAYSELTYQDVFADGVPEYFRPRSEPEALAEFVRATR